MKLDERPSSALGAALGQIEARTWVGIILGLATAVGAASGLQISGNVMADTPAEVAP